MLIKKILLSGVIIAHYNCAFGAAMEPRVTITPKKTMSLYLAHATVGRLLTVNGISFRIRAPYLYFEGCGKRIKLDHYSQIEEKYLGHFKECSSCATYRGWKMRQSVAEILKSSGEEYFDSAK